MQLKNLTLEISGKAFPDERAETMRATISKLFDEWAPLAKGVETLSVLLWIADGSEILDYAGNLDDRFEWAYWCGMAEHVPVPENLPADSRDRKSIFMFPRKTIPGSTTRSYRWLKTLIAAFKEMGTERFGVPVRVGAIFDIGPEFVISDFKYRRHREILSKAREGKFIGVDAVFHADTRKYAAYPDGIPEGLPFGEFFGRQFDALARDVGYSYIWFSNGIGFGHDPWSVAGQLYDKKRFHPERADAAFRAMKKFWDDFFTANPSVDVETRGSNFPAGIELASDAAPMAYVYREKNITAPVNPPMAALNYNTGLELSAWMSHIAELPPNRRLPFRFYIHDPWFTQDPWNDKFGREPWDLYAPLSVGRISEDGTVESPNSLSFLSTDDAFGRLSDRTAYEVVPHVLEAERTAPDIPGPLVWVYPFGEYSEMCIGPEKRLAEVYSEDFFIGETIQHGLPLNTVVSAGNFRKLVDGRPDVFAGRVIVAPVLAVEKFLESFRKALAHGCRLLVYGSTNGTTPAVRELLGLSLAEEGVEGKVAVSVGIEQDHYEKDGFAGDAYVHPIVAAGPLREIAAGAKCLAAARQGGEERVLASIVKTDGAEAWNVGFIRSVMPFGERFDPAFGWMDYATVEQAFPVPVLARWMLSTLSGWSLFYRGFSGSSKIHCFPGPQNALAPRMNISCSDNAFFFTVFAMNICVEILADTPLGAPVLTEMETLLENGRAVWHPGRSWHKECRCFVRQRAKSVVASKIQSISWTELQGSQNYAGFVDADVLFFPPKCGFETLEILYGETSIDPMSENLLPVVWTDTPFGRAATLHGVTGYLNFQW